MRCFHSVLHSFKHSLSFYFLWSGVNFSAESIVKPSIVNLYVGINTDLLGWLTNPKESYGF